ncbi:Uncharacterised protein [Mycobacteroides abscessus subsp. abscessus]|nr:Uncharacterised protein [Mycobacteroides abscessus subsp. abscessus]
MPKSATLSRAVETATKWAATASARFASESSMAPPWPRASNSQLRARRALVSVSRVVKVLDATMNRVVSGSRSPTFSARSLGSMFDTKRQSRASVL